MSKIRKIPELSVLHQHTAEVCITCPRAKMTKVEYKRSMSRAKEIFDLIHLDIWGPYKVMTRTHCRYFMTIVDDYSRVIWVQLLKQKSDAYEAIKGFLKMVKTQYGKQVKVIRSDNAFEFEDNQCKALYADQGVVHQTSCVDRPQQNGRAERKHRNILEMSRALRFQAGLALKYWGDCVQAAVHITNRLPTPLLNGLSPYEVMHNKKPNSSVLRTFGCLAMAYNPSRYKDKFEERGVPCVYLGNALNQKGYKLLNINTNGKYVFLLS
uniref:Integrase catalytic domain-containing protein n=1 Tax=Beta vulgaris subsp. maritima TaxID=350892 RepID=F4MLC7_BETVM|nr:hypothetical protein [Beta vulgaris subsp. maritima]